MADETGRAGGDWRQAAQWHREVAAVVAAADRAGLATTELPAVRAKLLEQSTRLTEQAVRSGASAPQLSPTADEVAAAGPALGDLSEGAAAAVLHSAWSTLAAVDAALASGRPAPVAPGSIQVGTAPAAPVQAPTPARTAERIPQAPAPVIGPPPNATPDPWALRRPGLGGSIADSARRSFVLRNAAVYGAYSAAVLAVQGVLFVLLDERSLPLAAPLCLLVLPALAWAAGYLTINALFAAPPGQRPNRSPRLGLVVCMVPNVLLLCALGILFASDLASH